MIGDLYNASNVVVGQAAVVVAPANTPLPPITNAGVNLADPFSLVPWSAKTLTVGASSTFTLTVGGQATTALTTASTAAQIQAALVALSTVGAGNATVTGSTGGPYTIVLTETVTSRYSLTVTASVGTAALSGGLWTPVGATDQGWKFTANKSIQEINIEEQSTPAATAINNQTVTIEGALSEDISSTLALAFNALLTQNVAATGIPGYDSLLMTDDVQYYAVALITKHVNGMPRWHYAPLWSQLTNTSTDFRRANAKRMYPVSFSTLCKPSQIQIVNFTAAGL